MLKEFSSYKHSQPSNILSLVQNNVMHMNISLDGIRETVHNVSNNNFTGSVLHDAREAIQDNVTPDYILELCKDPFFITPAVLFSGLCTLFIYYKTAATIHHEFYVVRRHESALWKIQPKFPPEDMWREEVYSGCMNSFFSGALGTSLFIWHQNSGIFKLHYTTGVYGLAHYFVSCVLVYFWIDFVSYWIHRALHYKKIYKYIHKWHHRYKQPTAFGAYAMHPLEYLSYQIGGMFYAVIFPVHVMAFLTVAIWIAYHAQVDHSGVDFDGDLPWVPSSQFHDNHHEFFHLNYGFTMVLWDWMFGTLRQSDRRYAEDLFEGEQDIVPPVESCKQAKIKLT